MSFGIQQIVQLLVSAFLVVFCFAISPAIASDHQDTTFLQSRLTSADLTDLFVFESPKDPSKVVLAMDFDPLIAKGEFRSFDPSVLYQFKIDKTGDGIEDLVMQFRINGRGRYQTVSVYGPDRPYTVGTQSKIVGLNQTGPLNKSFKARKDIDVFVGDRKDPFFFDLEQFFKIIPNQRRKGPYDRLQTHRYLCGL